MIEETNLASDAWKPLAFAGISGQGGRSPSTTSDVWDHYEEVLAEIATLSA